MNTISVLKRCGQYVSHILAAYKKSEIRKPISPRNFTIGLDHKGIFFTGIAIKWDIKNSVYTGALSAQILSDHLSNHASHTKLD
jgi:hypothetical protein